MLDIEELEKKVDELREDYEKLSKENLDLKMETLETMAKADEFYDYVVATNQQLKVALKFINKMTSPTSYSMPEISAMAFATKDEIEKLKKQEKK
jgi:hypothetical protein